MIIMMMMVMMMMVLGFFVLSFTFLSTCLVFVWFSLEPLDCVS